ncbi:hypothetical protein BJ122_12352 [Rhodopseudomonas faecalis]|uniref:Uncharacterized protein n=1 Tax=Rhodopseudomonas faecalis TaxID=99655 RepID=A0A318THR2_9BRAD|nr:hypothetical protein BJ122_12352 [Rhodopseudomonas faecalis]
MHSPSWPGLSRPSTTTGKASLGFVDARVKPGHDDKREVIFEKAVTP